MGVSSILCRSGEKKHPLRNAASTGYLRLVFRLLRAAEAAPFKHSRIKMLLSNAALLGLSAVGRGTD